MGEDATNKMYFRGLSVAAAICVILSLVTDRIPPPDAWLIEWTDWALQVGAIVVTTRAVWVLASAAAAKLKGN